MINETEGEAMKMHIFAQKNAVGRSEIAVRWPDGSVTSLARES